VGQHRRIVGQESGSTSRNIHIIEKVIDKIPELLFEIDELVESPRSIFL